MSAQVVGTLRVSFAHKKFDEQGALADPQTGQALEVLVKQLVQQALLNRSA